MLSRLFVDERLFDDNGIWQDQWLSNQIWSQTMHKLNQGGMQNAWPTWAGQMIDSSHLLGHVDLPAPQAAQMAALLANENHRELYQLNSIR